MMLCSIGPRQITGLSPGLSKPIEIILTPCACTGMMCWSAVAAGSCSEPSMIGTFGPYTSASNKPTLLPSFTSASARFTATVVLPTPPLPLATAIRFFTPGIGWRWGICCGAGPGGIVGFPVYFTKLGACSVAFFVFLAGATRARIIAADFCAGTNGLRRFGLRCSRLVLHFFFLALLLAFHFFGERRQLGRSLGGARRGAGSSGQWPWRTWSRW